MQNGNVLLPEVSKDLYDKARQAFYNDDLSEFSEWEIGCIGFLASYNGRFFDGGYAKSGYEKTKKGLRYRDYYQESKNNILRQASNLRGITFEANDYRKYTDIKNCCIYVDPPYQNTKKFRNAANFDYDEFWNVMRNWSKNNIVIISEQTAPSDFLKIWEHTINRSIKATDKSFSNEKLFVLRKQDE